MLVTVSVGISWDCPCVVQNSKRHDPSQQFGTREYFGGENYE